MTMESPTAIFTRMTASAVDSLRAHHVMLTELDSVIGDGDHGTTVQRVCDRIEGVVANGPDDLAGLLRRIGETLFGLDGGATGPLFGVFFLGLSTAPAPDSGCPGWAVMFEAGRDALLKRTKARVGDKTLMDALLPAVEAMRAAAGRGDDLGTALAAAASAAQTGAAATARQVARFGRARFLGERALGHPDPGAASMALLFEGFAHALQGVPDNNA